MIINKTGGNVQQILLILLPGINIFSQILLSL